VRVLVFLEHHDGAIVESSLALLSKASSLSPDELACVLVGEDVTVLSSQPGRYGADRIFVADDAAVGPALPQPRADVLADLVAQRRYDTILFAVSVLAADVAAGLAVRLEAGLNWDLVDIAVEDGRLVGTRAALADSVHAKVGWEGEPRIGLFRAGSFKTVEATGRGEVESVPVELEPHSLRTTMVEAAHADRSGSSIADADVVVAGGRGMGGSDGVVLLEELARTLNGVVGGTRPVVDAGWLPFAAQIGQTGRAIAPKLYIGCGVSGAIQHKVGMQRSSVIVAINTDRNAPIFELADLGVVGDINTVLPRLIELLRSRAG
jgi:electron transfer flavoprotein alpha subunit